MVNKITESYVVPETVKEIKALPAHQVDKQFRIIPDDQCCGWNGNEWCVYRPNHIGPCLFPTLPGLTHPRDMVANDGLTAKILADPDKFSGVGRLLQLPETAPTETTALRPDAETPKNSGGRNANSSGVHSEFFSRRYQAARPKHYTGQYL